MIRRYRCPILSWVIAVPDREKAKHSRHAPNTGLCDFLHMTECELSELYYHLSIRKEVRITDLTLPHPLVPLDAGSSPFVPWSAISTQLISLQLFSVRYPFLLSHSMTQLDLIVNLMGAELTSKMCIWTHLWGISMEDWLEEFPPFPGTGNRNEDVWGEGGAVCLLWLLAGWRVFIVTADGILRRYENPVSSAFHCRLKISDQPRVL